MKTAVRRVDPQAAAVRGRARRLRLKKFDSHCAVCVSFGPC